MKVRKTMTNFNFTLDNLNDDIIDVCNIIEYYESLNEDDTNEKEIMDFIKKNILDELAGNGGDEEWRGEWYPVTLIADWYFTTYAEDFAKDCFDVSDVANWPYNHIDWERAANELMIDYSEIIIKHDDKEYSFLYR